MDFSKSKVLLKKINAIHDSVALSEGKISSLEKDLLCQYLRDLYECVAKDGVQTEERRGGKLKVNNLSPIHEEVDQITTNIHQPNHHSESSDPPHRDQSLPQEDHPPVQEFKTQKKSKSVNPELEALFGDLESSDLAQKFANTPIEDVSRAMGINDRILTINELFKGDQKFFQEVVNQLNTMPSFEDAKTFLIRGVATKNDWSNEKNREKAEVFVKLVRRRYL